MYNKGGAVENIEQLGEYIIMLKLLPIEIENAIAITVSGKLDKSDINEVIKAIETKFLQSGQVSIYVEVDTFGGITLDALIAELKFALPNFKRFSKKAVVTEKKWIEKWIEIADPLFPSIQVKHFTHAQKAEAIAWLKA
ncbi:STAS/SEC14 domain-containing protein [Crocosphaera sp.]|uniref:STAS/SEC14 domain-containing protein n=1 Tax=Crocosphaera sp. TaxID=2729996 RepID=UPI0026057F60|nr:STAS/SEC14 domain-containing protein [Crocosphaera sp.]MDJ0579732.1 STAS/SEC14 domain-containing protein [Crocosphaera sp.]